MPSFANKAKLCGNWQILRLASKFLCAQETVVPNDDLCISKCEDCAIWSLCWAQMSTAVMVI